VDGENESPEREHAKPQAAGAGRERKKPPVTPKDIGDK
jgi:hypothetical protein